MFDIKDWEEDLGDFNNNASSNIPSTHQEIAIQSDMPISTNIVHIDETNLSNKETERSYSNQEQKSATNRLATRLFK